MLNVTRLNRPFTWAWVAAAVNVRTMGAAEPPDKVATWTPPMVIAPVPDVKTMASPPTVPVGAMEIWSPVP